MSRGSEPPPPFDPCASPEVEEYVRALAGRAPPGGALETRIHPRDEMYRFELAAPHRTADVAAIRYFAVGNSVARTVGELSDWRFGGCSRVGGLLDFAAGYGRTTRFLVRMLDAARITAVEIDADAVRFQAETFGVRGVVSSHDPEALSLAGPFDLVLAVSLFSHLPEGRFEAWLGRLWGLVGPRGLLAFSTNGERVMPGSVRMPSSGLAYAPQSETTRLSARRVRNDVGHAGVRPARGRRRGSRGRARVPRGRVVRRAGPLRPRSRRCPREILPLARDPMGVLEWAAVEGGAVTARGWAAGRRGRAAAGREALRRPPSRGRLPREGAAGLSPRVGFVFPTAGIPPDRVIRIEAESERGASRLLVAETLGPYLPRP